MSKLEFSAKLKQSLNSISQEIAADLQQASADAGEPDHSQDSEVVAEVCMDANRLSTFGYKEADEEVTRLVAEFGYEAVLQEAAKHVATY